MPLNTFKPALLCLATLIMFCISSCSSPQKLYEKGKYDKAYDAALSEVKEKKDRKSKLLLNKAFAKWLDDVRTGMIVLADGYEIGDLTHNLDLYAAVDDRYAQGSVYLDDENHIKYDKIMVDRDAEIDATYDEGLALLADYRTNQEKRNAQAAYYHFRLVDEYGNSDYPELDQLMSDALDLGTIVYNVTAQLDFGLSYEWDVDRRFDDMEGREGFVQVVYNGPSSVGDCQVVCDFSRLDENYRTNVSNQNFSKEVEDGYKTHVDTSGNSINTPIYRTVTGTVQTTRTSKIIAWQVDLEVRNVTGHCDLREYRFTEQVVDEVDEYATSGDDRAIPSQYFQQNNQRLEDTDDMVDDLIDELYRDIRAYIFD